MRNAREGRRMFRGGFGGGGLDEPVMYNELNKLKTFQVLSSCLYKLRKQRTVAVAVFNVSVSSNSNYN